MTAALFRAAALEARERRTRDGDILRVDAAWPGITYWLVVATALAAAIFVVVVPVSEYASGPAVVRVEGRRIVPAVAAGTVQELLVQVGEPVEAGALLVRLDDEREAAEVERATASFELQLARLLRDPLDAVARETLAGLRSEREAAEGVRATRRLRAPLAGVVSEVHTRVGQRLDSGDIAVVIAPPKSNVEVLAVVPGDYRPMLTRGQEVRFSLDGFKFDYHDLTVDQVSDEAVGPTEVRRIFGPELADALTFEPGAKTLVRARLEAQFVFEGNPYAYFDGLTGTVEVRVRREPILLLLVPALRQVCP